MWTHATSAPSASWNSVRRRAQTRRQPTTRGRADQLCPDRDRRDDRDLRRADEPGDAALGVPRPPEPAGRGVIRRPGPGCSAAGPTSGSARRDRIHRSGRGMARSSCRARGRVTGSRARASSSVSSETRAVPSCGAVCRASRTSHDRRASNTTRATASRSSSSAACVRASSSWWRTSALMPRAPHLQSYASADPLRSTVTSYGWISAADAVEQDPPLAADRVRPDPPREELRGDLLDERAADLAADLLAAVGDGQRRLEDRLRAGHARRRRPSPTARTGSGTSSASRPDRSSRRSSRRAPAAVGRASHRRAGWRCGATCGSAWMPA